MESSKTVQEIVDEVNNTFYFTRKHFKLAGEENANEAIGSGAFSHVYPHKDNDSVVFKVMQTEYNLDTIEYLNYAMKRNHLNSLLPKVFTIREKGDHCVVVMERLVSNACEAWRFIHDNFYFHDVAWKKVRIKKGAAFEIKDFINQVRKIRKVHDSIFDFHDGNVMYRGDVPVFTDPLYMRQHLDAVRRMG